MSSLFMTVFAVMLITTSMFPVCALSDGVGPPSFQVDQDWRSVCKNDPCCRDCFSLKSVLVQGTDVVTPEFVKLLVEIRGDFMWDRKCSSVPGGPVFGIKKDGTHTLKKTLVYKKYGNKWNLESWYAAGRHY